jgi:hypothetical protein
MNIVVTLGSREEERGWAVGRLTTVNLDKNTMAGLAKVAASLVQQGVAMQRKGLGMDLVRGGAAPQPIRWRPRATPICRHYTS